MILFLLSGFLAALFALVLEFTLYFLGFEYNVPREYITDPAPYTPIALALFALIEETVKFSVLRKIASRSDAGNIFPKKTLAFALDFTAVELFLASSKFPDAPVIALAGIAIVHLATILLYGYGIGKHFPKTKLSVFLLAGTLFHFFYNFTLN